MIKPILLLAFNRPNETEAVLNAIRIARPTKLFISCDGPRANNCEDLEKCASVKMILEDIDWDCNVQKLYHDKNLGCSKAPIAALKWFFSDVESGIILEDDCLPAEEFFSYCSVLLDYYEHNNTILNICGSNMGANKKDKSGYFFSRFMNMSGWATWRRSALHIDYELSGWKNSSRSLFFCYKLLRQNLFDLDIHWYKYWKEKFEKTVNEKPISWWDWQWIFFQLKNRKLSIIPNQNLVTNIGFNTHATHTIDPNNPLANIPLEKLTFPLHHPRILKPDLEYEEQFVKWVWCYHKRLPVLFHLKHYFSKFLKKDDN